MSFLDRIRAVNNADLTGFRPFRVESLRLGFIQSDFAEILTRWPQVFRVAGDAVDLVSRLDTVKARSEAVNEILLALRDEGIIQGWRDEFYPVNRYFAESPYLLMERAAVPFFGVRAYGVHMNGYIRDQGEIKMWIARRALDKPNEPGKLDQLVAGGQPVGIGLKTNMIKECWEEAGIPKEIASQVIPVGAITYCRQTAYGLKPDVIFNFDLELPTDFMPHNTDGEVEAFYLWSMEQVMDAVQNSKKFKLNCALVIIDFLVRHGFISPEHPDYLEILRGLLAEGQNSYFHIRR